MAFVDFTDCFRALSRVTLANYASWSNSLGLIFVLSAYAGVSVESASDRAKLSTSHACAAFASASSSSSATTRLSATVVQYISQRFGVVSALTSVFSQSVNFFCNFLASAASPSIHWVYRVNTSQRFLSSSFSVSRANSAAVEDVGEDSLH